VIVADTSALIAAMLNESLGPACRNALSGSPHVAISAGTLVEFLIVTSNEEMPALAKDFLDELAFDVIDVSEIFAVEVGRNYRRWGRGHHAAKLNMGDCYAYTLAADLERPLLFIGNDFSQTDIRSVLANPDPNQP
jgi:ribonuclease VapC